MERRLARPRKEQGATKAPWACGPRPSRPCRLTIAVTVAWPPRPGRKVRGADEADAIVGVSSAPVALRPARAAVPSSPTAVVPGPIRAAQPKTPQGCARTPARPAGPTKVVTTPPGALSRLGATGALVTVRVGVANSVAAPEATQVGSKSPGSASLRESNAGAVMEPLAATVRVAGAVAVPPTGVPVPP